MLFLLENIYLFGTIFRFHILKWNWITLNVVLASKTNRAWNVMNAIYWRFNHLYFDVHCINAIHRTSNITSTNIHLVFQCWSQLSRYDFSISAHFKSDSQILFAHVYFLIFLATDKRGTKWHDEATHAHVHGT